MSDASVAVEANYTINLPKVSLRIEQLKALRLKRYETTIDKVVAEYAKLAFLDVRKAFTPDGDLIPISELDDDTAAAIAGYEFENIYDYTAPAKGKRKIIGKVHKIKLTDKRGALDSLAKYLQMFTDKMDINLDVKAPEVSEILRERFTKRKES